MNDQKSNKPKYIKPLNLRFDPRKPLSHIELSLMRTEIYAELYPSTVEREKEVQLALNEAELTVSKVYQLAQSGKKGGMDALLQIARYSTALVHETLDRKKEEAMETLSNWDLIPVNWDPTSKTNEVLNEIWHKYRLSSEAGIRKTNSDNPRRNAYMNRKDPLDAFVLSLYLHVSNSSRFFKNQVKLALAGRLSVSFGDMGWDEGPEGKLEFKDESKELRGEDAVEKLKAMFPKWMVDAAGLDLMRTKDDVEKWFYPLMDCLDSFSEEPRDFPVLRSMVNNYFGESGSRGKRRGYVRTEIKKRLKKIVSLEKKP